MCQLRRIYSFCETPGLTEYPIFVVTGRNVLRWAIYDETEKFTKQTFLKVDGNVEYFFDLGKKLLNYYLDYKTRLFNDTSFFDCMYAPPFGYVGQSIGYLSDWYEPNLGFIKGGSFIMVNPVVIGSYLLDTYAYYTTW